jgi:RND family efflux transporter MFP subunit
MHTPVVRRAVAGVRPDDRACCRRKSCARPATPCRALPWIRVRRSGTSLPQTSRWHAQLAQTDDQLAHSRLTAPFAGVIADRVRRAGEEVARGEIVARLVDPGELEIRLFVPLRYVRAIQPGNAVKVTIDRRSLTAAVGGIVPTGDPRTQSFEVIVKAPAVDGLLAAGDTVQVELPPGEPQRRLAVTRDALIIRADALYVFRVSTDQRAERVDVKAGLADGDWIGVEGKLNPGDDVVVRGGELLRGNEKLQVVGMLEVDR